MASLKILNCRLIYFNVLIISMQDSRSVSPFIAYALCAAEEALSDANWHPRDSEGLERTVRKRDIWLSHAIFVDPYSCYHLLCKGFAIS
jgi:3-oxoacyl-(acyl-carrier-protein) synthase